MGNVGFSEVVDGEFPYTAAHLALPARCYRNSLGMLDWEKPPDRVLSASRASTDTYFLND